MTEHAPCPGRRSFLQVILGLLVAVGFRRPGFAAAAAQPKAMRPQPGDRLVHASGARKGEIVDVDDLPEGGPQVLAYPLEPESRTVRSGSRLNQVALVRLDPAQLDEETRTGAAEGVVAYSAVCTHQGCPVSMWNKKTGTLFCSCHASQYDPRQGAAVVAGPAPRRLARLPLKMEDGLLTVAEEFTGRVGFK